MRANLAYRENQEIRLFSDCALTALETEVSARQVVTHSHYCPPVTAPAGLPIETLAAADSKVVSVYE